MKTFCSALVSLVSAALFVQALPTHRDPSTPPLTATDVVLFKFADMLEQLEGTYYATVLSKFQPSDFVTAGFQGDPAKLMDTIRGQEAVHSAFLQATLRSDGQTPLSCKFNFEAALKDPASAVAIARTAEQIGTSAFAGAAHLLANPSFLTKAATIMSDEARHSSTLNTISGTGTPFPAPFDVALNANEVLALVGPFIEGPCNTTIPPNPMLTITNQGAVKTGTLVTFDSTAFPQPAGLFCQIISGNITQAVSMPLNHCIIPGEGVVGPTFIWVTANPEPLANDIIARANSKVVAGPALTFVDN